MDKTIYDLARDEHEKTYDCAWEEEDWENEVIGMTEDGIKIVEDLQGDWTWVQDMIEDVERGQTFDQLVDNYHPDTVKATFALLIKQLTK
jgi:hypothetical protein